MRRMLMVLAVLGTVLVSGCEGDGGVDSTSTVESAVQLAAHVRVIQEDDPDWDCTVHGNGLCSPWPGRLPGWAVAL